MWNRAFRTLLPLLLICLGLNACDGSSSSSGPVTEPVTARMLVSPNALVGPGPSGFSWSPTSARLAYVDSSNGHAALWLYDPDTGTKRLLFDPATNSDSVDPSSVQWSPKGDLLLLAGKTSLWLLDPATGSLKFLATGGAKTAQAFLPDGSAISYVQDNDLYLVRISDGLVQRLTSDATVAIFNGSLDWVYNEELATRAAQPAYAWSPDSRRLFYLQLDDTGVQNHPVTDYSTTPPTIRYTRYPVTGSPNPRARLHLIDTGAGGIRQTIPLPSDVEYVLPLFSWTPDGREALYLTVSRDHTELKLWGWNPVSATARTIITETDPTWINEYLYTPPVFIANGSRFLWLSERSGFMQLYLYTAKGELVRQLTSGNWLIETSPWNLITAGRPVHVEPSGRKAYFITTAVTPLERRLMVLDINTGTLEPVSTQPGFHLFSLSGDGAWLVDQYSDVTTPPVTTVVKTDRSATRQLARCSGPSLKLPTVTREFVTLKAQDGADLFGQLVKPEGFDPSRSYPVVIHWYGGPTLQMVANRYGTTNIFNLIERDVLYTQAGFLVWRVDNRGTAGRGHGFETPIFGQLGPTALQDQLTGVEYLRSLPYVDMTRIGVDGKSFGGFLTLYALLNSPDTFRCGVAVAGPTNWAWYDTIYTERYMRTPTANPSGYAATNLIPLAAKIKVRPLLVHGLADTNVHLENTVNFISALEKADKPFNFIPLPATGHSISGDSLAATLSAGSDYFRACLGAGQ